MNIFKICIRFGAKQLLGSRLLNPIREFHSREQYLRKIETDRLELIKVELIERKIESSYLIGNFFLQLSRKHALPKHQKTHPLYDKFLAFLVELLPSDATVIQVGSNVGDSLALMVSANQTVKYVNIEGSKEYFDLLEINVQSIKKFTTANTININAMIAGKLDYSGLELSEGTAKAKIAESNDEIIPAISLDQLILNYKLSNIALLIVDVDGFDFDVITSGMSAIEKFQPVIYFEMMPTSRNSKLSYEALLKQLQAQNYNSYAIFDNFGNLINPTATIDEVFQIMEYVFRQNTGSGTRTIWYLDILAWTFKDLSKCISSTTNYIRENGKFAYAE